MKNCYGLCILAVYIQLTVLGTPAEEGPGGKIPLIDSGAFKDVDIALMAHPGKHNIWRANTLARDKLRITFHGRCSHASISPWDGLNALDAAVLFHQNVACLRQQMKPSWKVHGVICQGGVASNIIPELTELDYRVRAPNVAELETLTKRVIDCCQGAALATGCKVEYEFLPSRYLEMLSNEPLIQLFEQNVGQLQLEEDSTGSFGGSTDMGNVSHVVPSIHPIFKIGTEASNHTRTFQIAAGSATAQKFTRDIAKALAMTAVDVYLNPAILRKVREEFVQDAKS